MIKASIKNNQWYLVITINHQLYTTIVILIINTGLQFTLYVVKLLINAY